MAAKRLVIATLQLNVVGRGALQESQVSHLEDLIATVRTSPAREGLALHLTSPALHHLAPSSCDPPVEVVGRVVKCEALTGPLAEQGAGLLLRQHGQVDGAHGAHRGGGRVEQEKEQGDSGDQRGIQGQR
jgi:hypothetical protein